MREIKSQQAKQSKMLAKVVQSASETAWAPLPPKAQEPTESGLKYGEEGNCAEPAPFLASHQGHVQSVINRDVGLLIAIISIMAQGYHS